jgi:excisionase family DNA binding protein
MAGHVKPATPRRRLASTTEAAIYADLSTRTIRRYIAEGRLPGYRVGPRLVKIDLDDLDSLAQPIPTAG